MRTEAGKLKDFIERIQTLPQYRKRISHIKYLPAREGNYKEPTHSLPEKLQRALKSLGINKLYSHQAQALNLIREGKNVAIVTPTASGKTLAFNLPVLEKILEDGESKALYLFPTKALAQDQLNSIRQLFKAAGVDSQAQIYDGDTTPYRRLKIRKKQPNIIMSNPDMLHAAILAHHSAWADFFGKLKFVVVDEIHSYRGIFGCHVAHILRRLRRVCSYYGSNPQFILCSATMANPQEFVEKLTGLKHEIIKENGAPGEGKYFILWKPMDSPYGEAVGLFNDCINHGLKTIVFTKARKITELIHKWSKEVNPETADKISSYRAGYLSEQRREIERRLFEEDLMGVISTSALEVGINVGGLDVCILVGYPGSVLSTWQRAGRVGREDRKSLIIMIALEDALDHYFMEHPQDFFKRSYETAILDVDNPVILKNQLRCGASELPLTEGEENLFSRRMLPSLRELVEEGQIFQSGEGREWYSREKRPHRKVNIRSIGETYAIVNEETGNLIGTIGYPVVFRDCHQGAIYLHAGTEYLITELDLETKTVVARETLLDYYTQPTMSEEVQILKVYKEKRLGEIKVALGKIRVSEKVICYERKSLSNRKKIDEHPLSLPPFVYETMGLWIGVPSPLREKITGPGRDFLGGMHGVEHALIAIFPLFALCDRWDLGGVSYLQHEGTGLAITFIHDAYPGGVGLSERAFEVITDLIKTTYRLVDGCPCREGCPSCIHSPKCGSGNRPLDKEATLAVLGHLVSGKETTVKTGEKTAMITKQKPEPAQFRPHNIIFLDIETQKLAQEVGGWSFKERMKVSLVVIYSTKDQGYRYFEEEEIPQLLDEILSADLVVGFNIKGFDWAVLQPYFRYDLNRVPTLDILEIIHSKLGFRLSLSHLAEMTLGRKKEVDGIQAVTWYREGDMENLKKYCRNDVELTKELYEFGKQCGYLLFQSREGQLVRASVDW